jgi:exonuclease SbcD
MPFLLLHTADLHLGKSFRGLPPKVADQRRQDLLATLRRISARARQEKADLLVIAGDLFDRAEPSAGVLQQARLALEDAALPVLVLPGNHDPLLPTSPYLDGRWPGNVTIASQPGWQRCDIGAQEVWAFGYTTADAHLGVWEQFPGCGASAILAAHASCLAPGLGDEGQYYRFAPGEIPPCAYLALGHHHRYAQVSRRPVACYCGSPEPLDAQEAQAVTLRVEVEDGESIVTPLALGARRHNQMTFDITGLSADDVYRRIEAALTADDLLTVRLTGLLDPDEPVDAGLLEAELGRDAFYVRVDDRQLLVPTEVGNAGGVMGSLLRIVHGALANVPPDHQEHARLLRAARYAQLALEGKLSCG